MHTLACIVLVVAVTMPCMVQPLKSGNISVLPPNAPWAGSCIKCYDSRKIMSDGAVYSEISCKDKLMNENCECKLSHQDCWNTTGQHNPLSEDEQYRILDMMKLNPCKPGTKIPSPRVVCGVQSTSACSTELKQGSFLRVYAYGKSWLTSNVNLRTIQPHKPEDASVVIPKCDNPFGTADWCKIYPTDRACQHSSQDAQCIKDVNRAAFFTVLSIKDCLLPIKEWIEAPIYYYPYKIQVEDEDFCKNCWVHCTADNVIVSARSPSVHSVEICDAKECEMKPSNRDSEIYYPRSFHCKTSTSRISVSIWSTSGAVLDLSSDCPIVDVCKAISCTFCWEHLMNPPCWSAGFWTVIICVSWMIIVVLGITLIVLKPMLKTIIYFFQCLFCASKVLFRIIFKLHRVSRNVTTRAFKRAYDYSEIEMTPIHKPTTYSTKPTNELSWMMVVVMLMALVTPAIGDDSCSTYNSFSYKSETCTSVGGELSCRDDITFDIVPAGIDQTECFSIRHPSGSILSGVRLTVASIDYLCSKETLYYTLDSIMQVDSRFYCAHSGPCFGTWCEGVNKIGDLPMVPYTGQKGPGRALCLRSQGCAGMGCFLCSPSCVLARWYASPISDKKYEVFRCSQWTPVITAVVTISTKAGMTENRLVFKDNQMIEVQDMKIRASLSVKDQISAFSKTFVRMSQNHISMIDVAPKGQPIQGMVGQVQCAEETTAPEECNVAPKVCSCSASADKPLCECTQVPIRNISNSETCLPQKFMDMTLKPLRDSVSIAVGGVGRVGFKISTSTTLVAISEQESSCEFKLQAISGCYLCHSGAVLNYSCTSMSKQTSLASCNGREFPISCDKTDTIKSVIIQHDFPTISIKCVASCKKDKETSISGILSYVGYYSYSNSTRMQISDYDNSTSRFWNSIDLPKAGNFLANLFSGIGFVKGLVIIVAGVILVIVGFKISVFLLRLNPRMSKLIKSQ